jgi:hypothetical protein
MLLAVLQEGDIIELCRNSFLRMLCPDSQGVLVNRGGEVLRIDRRQLRREPLEPPKPEAKKPPTVTTRGAKPSPPKPPHPEPKKITDDSDFF